MIDIEEKELLDILLSLTTVQDEDGNQIPNYCFASDLTTDLDCSEEEISIFAIKNGYKIFKVFPSETMVGGLVIVPENGTIEPVKKMYEEFYGEIPEISEMVLKDDILVEKESDDKLNEDDHNITFDEFDLDTIRQARESQSKKYMNEIKKRFEDRGATIEFHKNIYEGRDNPWWYIDDSNYLITIKHDDYTYLIETPEKGDSFDIYEKTDGWRYDTVIARCPEEAEFNGIFSDKDLEDDENRDIDYEIPWFDVYVIKDDELAGNYEMGVDLPDGLKNILNPNFLFGELTEEYNRFMSDDDDSVEESKEDNKVMTARDPNAMSMWGNARSQTFKQKKGKGSFDRNKNKKIPLDEEDRDITFDEIDTNKIKKAESKAFMDEIRNKFRDKGASVDLHRQLFRNKQKAFWYHNGDLADIHYGDYTINIYIPEISDTFFEYTDDNGESHDVDTVRDAERLGIFSDDDLDLNDDRVDWIDTGEFEVWINKMSRESEEHYVGASWDLGFDNSYDLNDALDPSWLLSDLIDSYKEYIGEDDDDEDNDDDDEELNEKKDNELTKRARKHKKSDKRGAMGWFRGSHPSGATLNTNAGNVEANVSFFNRAMGSSVSTGAQADGGVGAVGCCEDMNNEIEFDDTGKPYAFTYSLLSKFITRGYDMNTNKEYFYPRVPESSMKVSRDDYANNKLLRRRVNKPVMDGVKKFFNDHPKAKWCVIDCQDSSHNNKYLNVYRVLMEKLNEDNEETSEISFETPRSPRTPHGVTFEAHFRDEFLCSVWGRRYRYEFVCPSKAMTVYKSDFKSGLIVFNNGARKVIEKFFKENPHNSLCVLKAFRNGKEIDANTVYGVTLHETITEDIEKHDTLNPKLWNEDNTLKPEVKEKIDAIVKDFTDGLSNDGIKFNLKDVKLVGSNCSYNYNDKSDLDVHLVMDTDSLECPDDLYPLLYSAYRSIWNKNHDVDFYGIPVEIFVETDDTEQMSEPDKKVEEKFFKKKLSKKIIKELKDKISKIVKVVPNIDELGNLSINNLSEKNAQVVASNLIGSRIVGDIEFRHDTLSSPKNVNVNDYTVTGKILVKESLDEARVQTAVKSNGIYSVMNNEWIKEPVAEDIPEVDHKVFDAELNKWLSKVYDIIGTEDITEASNTKKLYAYDGPIVRFDKIVKENTHIETMAVSFKQAINNIKFKACSEIGYARDKGSEVEIDESNVVEISNAEPVTTEHETHQKCQKCGTELNDSGECPLCDLGDESVLDESEETSNNYKIEEIEDFIEDIYDLRKSSIANDGEYGIGNLVFKEIRNRGYLDALKELKNKLKSRNLSLEEPTDIDENLKKDEIKKLVPSLTKEKLMSWINKDVGWDMTIDPNTLDKANFEDLPSGWIVSKNLKIENIFNEDDYNGMLLCIKDLLRKYGDEYYIGTYKMTRGNERGRISIDANKIFDDTVDAIKFGLENEQESIYNTDNDEYIYLSRNIISRKDGNKKSKDFNEKELEEYGLDKAIVEELIPGSMRLRVIGENGKFKLLNTNIMRDGKQK